jgi:hypothetical protein
MSCVLGRVVFDIEFSWYIPAQDAVGVFDGPALPGRMWISEVDRHIQCVLHVEMVFEFFTVVIGDGFTSRGLVRGKSLVLPVC